MNRIADGDLRVVQDREAPWMLTIYELLTNKAPGPARCQPFCCYRKTVIFYQRPYVLRPWHRYWTDAAGKRHAQRPGMGYERFAEVESQYTWNDIVKYNGDWYVIGQGTVVWHNKAWWMRHRARRLQ